MRKKSAGSPSRTTLYITAGLFFLYFVLMLFQGNLVNSILRVVPDTLLCLLGLLFWMFFFSQFVLPLRTIRDRLSSFTRLIMYTLHSHGPAVLVENGTLRQRKGEIKRRGPGVAILDTASGVVLRTAVQYTRSKGPGVVFTELGEGIGGTVDLHIQRQRLGPNGNENPFLAQADDESDDEFRERRKRASETRALTRDGIEVIPNIIVKFKLDTREGEGNTRFGYNDETTQRAVIGRTIDLNRPEDAADRQLEWNQIPAYIASDLWREYLGKFTLSELFTAPPGEVGALAGIIDSIRNRMQNETYRELDTYGQPRDTQPIPSPEYQLLTSRGIRVRAVVITQLRLPESIERQIVNLWKDNWKDRANNEKAFADSQNLYYQELGRRLALNQFADGAGHYLVGLNRGTALNQTRLLRQMLHGTIELSRHDNNLQTTLGDELKTLDDLYEWTSGGGVSDE